MYILDKIYWAYIKLKYFLFSISDLCLLNLAGFFHQQEHVNTYI